jgi:type III secretion protein J
MRKAFTALILCLSFALAACQQQVYTGLTGKDANEMVALLYRNGISSSREIAADGTYAISVDSANFAPAVEILNRYGYPHERYQSVADVFKGDGLIVSPFEQKARLNYAIAQELTKTISEIDGVVEARVHVVLPELDLRSGNNTKASSSVMVVHRPSVDTLVLSEKIRLLVANAIQDMDYRNVSIAFFPSDGTISGSLAADGGPEGSSVPAAGTVDVAQLFSSTPSTSFLLWIVAGIIGVFSIIIFLRRLQGRA